MCGIEQREWIKTMTTIVFCTYHMPSHLVHPVHLGGAEVNKIDPVPTLPYSSERITFTNLENKNLMVITEKRKIHVSIRANK